MACIRPPALTEQQLLAWIDGAATDDVAVHVQQCVDCRGRASQLARQQNQLAIQLYRVACPSPLELGEYQLDLLPAARRLSVEEHLATCLHCAQEMQTTAGYLLDFAPPLITAPSPEPFHESVGQRLQVLVARLIDTLSGSVIGGGMTPTLAGMRGEPEAQLVYAVDDLQIIIALPTEPKQLEHKGLLGLILGLNTEEQVEAQLLQSDRVLMRAMVDEAGNFVFEHLTPGLYTLMLQSPGRKIRIDDLSV
ncbi:hypothetical protein BH10CHL1_BH10CHL1_15930 [soil metagenome]